MNRFLLVLLSSPTLFGSLMSMLVMVSPAQATTTAPTVNNNLSCIRSPHGNGLTCIRRDSQIAQTPKQSAIASQPSSDDSTDVLDFTDEESDEAIALFGCDCPACIRSLRQLRSISPS
jgi:hypothetical protein